MKKMNCADCLSFASVLLPSFAIAVFSPQRLQIPTKEKLAHMSEANGPQPPVRGSFGPKEKEKE